MPEVRWLWAALAVLASVAVLPARADQGDALAAMAAARRALADHDGIAAEAALKRAIDAGAGEASVAALMGEALLLQDDLADARKWLEPARFSRDTASRGFRMLARLELREDDPEAASAAYDRALAVTPQDPELWVDIGRLRYRLGAQEEAIGASVHALRLDPANPVALVFRGQLVRDSQGLVAALPYFSKAQKAAPHDPVVLGEYAATLGEAGRAREMLKLVRRIIELDPGNAQAFYLQSVLAARAGKYGLAKRLMWRTGGAYADLPAGMMLSALLELQEDNSATAAVSLERLVNRQPHNTHAQLLFARALAQAGRWTELAERFGPLAERADASPYLLTLVGRAWEASGDRMEAARFLDRAAAQPPTGLVAIDDVDDPIVIATRWQSDPGDTANAIAHVRKLVAQGQAGPAEAAADRLLALHPGAYDTRFLAGDARLAAGNAAGALDAYAAAAAIRQPSMLAIRIAMARDAIGDGEGARFGLASYLAQHPRDGDVAALLARHALAQEDWSNALPLLDRAIALGLGAQDTRLLADRAQARLNLGRTQDAAGDAVAAYRLQRMNDRSAYVMGLVLRANGVRDDLAARLLARRPGRRPAGAN